MQHAKDIELVERIRRGDQEAWAAFLARYTDLIYGKARAYSRADREDEIAALRRRISEMGSACWIALCSPFWSSL